MEVKTRERLCIDSYSNSDDYDDLLVKIYHDYEKKYQFSNLSVQRVRNIVAEMIE
jgi:hypothetical protein